MEIWTVHYTIEQFDQSTDKEHDVTVYNIDFALPQFRKEVRLFKKIDAVIRKPNVISNTEV